MLRAIQRGGVFWMLTLATTIAAPAQDQDESRWKLYDLRDLAALLAAPPPVWAPADPAGSMSGGPESGAGGAPEEESDNLDRLIEGLTGQLVMGAGEMLDGLYAIEAEPEQHKLFSELLDRVRAMYARHYELEVSLSELNPSDAPQLGAAVDDLTPLFRQRLVLTGGAMTRLAWVTQHHYVSDLQAVVAESAVAFDPRTATVEGGLRMNVAIDGDPDPGAAGPLTLRMTGEYRSVQLERKSGTFSSSAGGAAWLDLPRTSICALASQLRIEPGQRVAVCIVDDVERGSAMVITARVRRLAD